MTFRGMLTAFCIGAAVNLASCDSLRDDHNAYFEKTLGFSLYDAGQAVGKTADGGFVIAGNTRSIRNNQDFYITKIDGNGELQWSKTIGGTSTDQAYAIAQTADGAFVIAGRFLMAGNRNDVFSIKIGQYGELIWSSIIGNRDDQEARAVAPTSDGGAVISGFTGAPSDLFIARYSTTGDSLWAQIYGKPNGFDYSRSIASSNGSDFFLTGYTSSISGINQPFITKINSKGQELWTSILSIQTRTEIYDMALDDDGSILLVGRTGVLPAPISVILIKTDPDGHELWTQFFAPSNVNEGNAIAVAKDGYIITGRTYLGSIANDANLLLLRTDKDGALVWTRSYGGDKADVGWDVQTVDQGGYLAIGATDSFGSGQTDVYIVKVNESGDIE